MSVDAWAMGQSRMIGSWRLGVPQRNGGPPTIYNLFCERPICYVINMELEATAKR